METWNERLKRSLEGKFKSVAEFARHSGVPKDSIHKYIKNGVNQPRGDTLDRLAVSLDVDLLWLKEGMIGSSHYIPVVGYVGAGGEFLPFDDHAKGGGIDEVLAPPEMTEKAVAVQVRGDSMYPVYQEGDILFYTRNGEATNIEQCIGKECVVQVSDGAIYIKILGKGSEPGLFTLSSFNHPPIVDITIEWAAKVSYVKKG
ncbi:MAG: helix-turn-helix transcriptional regulator [Emcibacter sp.]|nr:helix-turn-helix transcriptional regulator [Emcibacter sp.]